MNDANNAIPLDFTFPTFEQRVNDAADRCPDEQVAAIVRLLAGALTGADTQDQARSIALAYFAGRGRGDSTAGDMDRHAAEWEAVYVVHRALTSFGYQPPKSEPSPG